MSDQGLAEGGPAVNMDAFIAYSPGKGKGKSRSTDPLVLSSLNSALPIALPEVTPVLQSRSAPSSPEGHSPKKGFLKRFRPPSPGARKKSGSLGAVGSNGTRGHRPKWLPFKGRRKSRSPEEMNGSATPSPDPRELSPDMGFHNSGSNNSLGADLVVDGYELDATPVAALPGSGSGQLVDCLDNPLVPTIMVSHMGDGGEVQTNNSSPECDSLRKMSQSSHHSHCSTLLSGTSGVGSLLSDPASDMESPVTPLSPLSGAESFQGLNEDMRTSDFAAQSDNDCIERDAGPEHRTICSPSSDRENTRLTTPTPPREQSPEVGSGNESGKEGERTKKKRERRSRVRPWERVKRVVQAWSPFALQFYKKQYPWVQLAGHQGNFAPGSENGTIMKKSDHNERDALKALMQDILKPFVPEFRREREKDGEMYVEMTDLLREFDEPAVMDIKIGVRTYLEEELYKAQTKKVLRPDMYEKMIAVDPNEPTPEEHEQRAITKPRYMQWREAMSSSCTLGFRIEGIKTSEGKALKDFKTTKSPEDVSAALRTYLAECSRVKEPFLRRLRELRSALDHSKFLRTHELIGSSLLFVYDNTGLCSVHMIDFGKTVPLPPGVMVDHTSPWILGNHEDGYLWGLDNLIEMWQEL